MGKTKPFPGGLAWKPPRASVRRASPAASALRAAAAPGTLWVPLDAASGLAPLDAGEQVQRGQSLTREDGGPPSPVDGVVVGRRQVLLAHGAATAAVGVQPRSSEAPADALLADDPSPGPASREDPEPARLWAAGLDAHRVTCPDLRRQLELARRAADGRPAASLTLVCNLVDHEPPLALASLLAWRFPDTLLAGAALLGRLAGARRTIWAANQSAAVEVERLSRRAAAAGMASVLLAERYPQAHPTLLLHTLLGARLAPADLPPAAGALVADAPALLALGTFALRGRAPAELPVAILDRRTGRAHYALAPVGAVVEDLALALARPAPTGAAPPPAGPVRTYAGDLMARRRVPAGAVLGGSDLAFHILPDEGREVGLEMGGGSACVRCGWCASFCPTGVRPAALLEAAQRGRDMAAAERAGLRACIDCGICSYVCPAQLPLAAAVRTLRPDGAHDGQ